MNGRILTGEALLSLAPRYVSALLVENGLVIAAGATAELARLAPPGTLQVDLAGHFTMPGFNDAHLHLGEGARHQREVNLAGAASLEAALARIADAATVAAPDTWLTGGGWDETLWSPQTLPSRHDLDRVTGDHPAVFARIDVHLSVANTAALRAGGVTRATIAPAGSAIDHDQAGAPTGILRERAARLLVEQHIPVATLEERQDGLRRVLRGAVELGITSVQDNSTDEDFAALCALHARGELPLRISEWLPFDAPVPEVWKRRAQAPQDRLLRTAMLKAFLDGSLGSRTASMLEPYADDASTKGIPLYAQEQLTALAVERAEAGFALGFHAIGDSALAMAMETFAAVRVHEPGGVGKGPRLRIEHAQTAAPAAFAKARALDVIVSAQPCHLLSDARWVAQRLGPERTARAYAWRSFLDAGVPLAFGTDFPVEPLSPFRNLYAAVTRQQEHGGAIFHPEQRLTLAEALHAYTQGAAYAEGAEQWKGMLKPGHVADFAVLDRDLLTPAADPTQMLTTRVLRTVVEGVTVFDSADQGSASRELS